MITLLEAYMPLHSPLLSGAGVSKTTWCSRVGGQDGPDGLVRVLAAGRNLSGTSNWTGRRLTATDRAAQSHLVG